MKKIILLLLFFLMPCINLFATKDSTKRASFQTTSKQYDPNAPDDPTDTDLDPIEAKIIAEGNSSDNLAIKEKIANAKAEYELWNFHYKQRIFEFQYHSSIFIFIIVVFIVFIGLGFSAWQFYITMHQVKMKKELLIQNSSVAQEDPTASLKSDIEISTSGVKVNSSVLGVIIIALSIAFFYLYLIYVYPIHPVEMTPEQSATKTAKHDK